ncbi:unnamed protein product [Chrysoparadoxa australica]
MTMVLTSEMERLWCAVQGDDVVEEGEEVDIPALLLSLPARPGASRLKVNEESRSEWLSSFCEIPAYPPLAATLLAFVACDSAFLLDPVLASTGVGLERSLTLCALTAWFLAQADSVSIGNKAERVPNLGELLQG